MSTIDSFVSDFISFYSLIMVYKKKKRKRFCINKYAVQKIKKTRVSMVTKYYHIQIRFYFDRI